MRLPDGAQAVLHRGEVRPATEAEIQSGAADDPGSVILRILP